MRFFMLIACLCCAFSASAQTDLEPNAMADPLDETQGISESSTQDEAPVSEAETQAPAAPATAPAPAAPVVPEGEGFASGYRNVAVLQGLNKVTARISSVEAPVGASVQFGNLDIIVKRCWQAPPTERPENAALIEILDRKPGEAPQEVYNGWMFSSSPSLAGLEHPVYDVIVLSCENKEIKSDQ